MPEVVLTFFADLPGDFAAGVSLTRAETDFGDLVDDYPLDRLKIEPADAFSAERRREAFDPDRLTRFLFSRTESDAPDASVSGADSTAG